MKHSSKTTSLFGLSVIAMLTLLATSCAQVAPPPTPESTALGAYDDDPHEPSPNAAAVIAAGTDGARLAALERELVAAMQAPGSSPAAVQDAAQHLGYVLLAGNVPPESSSLAVLGRMLADEKRIEFARLALDRVPGPAVDALFVQALATATGETRLALIQSCGERAIASAVPVLASLFDRADPATAAATARALGRIGGAAALAALDQAKHPFAPEVLHARLAAARFDATVAAQVAEAILRNPAAPLPQRSAALRELIGVRPASAVDEIHAVLVGSEETFQQVAIEAVATLATPGAPAQLANHLRSYAPAVQVALAAALGARGDAGAIAGLLQTLEGTDDEVRLAVIDALGRLPGETAVAQRLATLAAGSGADAKAASTSLARLSGPGLDEFVRAQAAKGDASIRAVYLRQIAARNLTETIPFLLGLRTDPELSLRLEALDALRAIAAPSNQRPVIDWALGAEAKTEQTRAVRALIAILLRDDAVETRAGEVVATLRRSDANAGLVLLPVLSRVGGQQALAMAGALAGDPDVTLAAAAVAEMTRWPDASALPVLVNVAQSVSAETVRGAAALGAAEFLARRENQATRSATALTLLKVPLDAAAENALLHVLSLCADAEALATARLYLKAPETGNAARDAVDAITANLAGPPAFKASNAGAELVNLSDGNLETLWSVPGTPGEWLFADLRHSRPVRVLTLDQGPREWNWPAQIDIFVSDDPTHEGDLRAQAMGVRGQTVVSLPVGVRGRYLWIRQTGTRNAGWAIAELVVE